MSATTLDRSAVDSRPQPRRGSLARHSVYLTIRSLRALWRQPAFAVATLVQPIIWLLLFGQLFRRVVVQGTPERLKSELHGDAVHV